MKSLIIIPAYNEEENIENVVEKIKSYGYDYLVINDCSSDNTAEILKKNNYNHLDLSVNVGLAGVTRIGFMYGYDNDYDCVINVDGDGQHPVDKVKLLVDEIDKGYDYVVGSRFVSEKKPFSLRMIGSRLICGLIKLKTGISVYDPTSGMRALGRKVIEEFSKGMNYYAEPDALCHILKKGYRVKEVQVDMLERQGGVSYFANPFKTIKYMVAEILSILFVQW